jgi:transglutaminase TgpA-like protein/transglutaminase superfamily protein
MSVVAEVPSAGVAGTSPPSGEESSPAVLPVALAAALGTGAGAWLAGGLFRDFGARGVGFLGVAAGAGIAWFAFRRGRPLLQLLVLPAAAAVGAALVLAGAGSGATVPKLVGQAVRGAGLMQAPVPFDPGWRFVLVVLCALVASTSTALAVSAARPKLAVAAPLALIIPAALLQPDSAEVVSAAGAIVLVLLALAAARNAELAADGSLSFEFELNRLARTGALVAGLLVVLVAVSRFGLLFPATDRQQVVPPHRPQVAAAPPDQVLFTYRASRPVPLRMGVLDVYDGRGWLLPAFDPSKLATVQPGARFPEAVGTKGGVTVAVTLQNLEGRSVPAPAALVRLDSGSPLQFDPATQTLRLADRSATQGLTYELEADPPPTSKALAAAAAPPADLKPYLQAPAPPAEVARLLAEAPVNPYDRLQYLRQKLYANAVADGAGKPVDVPPDRVGALLDGAHGTPYEITAADALLARWAGVPSRIGYGYDGGDAQPDGSVAVHPVHAGMWLEAYFSGQGWVPLIGVPKQASQSISDARKNLEEGLQATQNLSIVVYVPVVQGSNLLLYEEVRYYLERALPAIALLLLLLLCYPAFVKLARRSRRRRWAGRGYRERIAVAYAEFRDRCTDLAIGDPTAPPLDFLASVQPDEEHAELAWLVTRALWGDLRRGLVEEDAVAADAMARSLRSRITAAQPFTTRLAAWISRSSLRRPYSREVPNLWPAPPESSQKKTRARRRWALLGSGAAVLVLLAVLVSSPALASSPGPRDKSAAGAGLDGLVPGSVGKLQLQLEKSADRVFTHVRGSVIAAGHVYSVRHDGIVEGSVQVEQLGGSLSTSNQQVRSGILQSLGGGAFHDLATPVYLFDGNCGCAGSYRLVPVRNQQLYGRQRVFEQDLPALRVYAWFPPHRNVLVIVAVRSEFTRAAGDAFALALVQAEQGR